MPREKATNSRQEIARVAARQVADACEEIAYRIFVDEGPIDTGYMVSRDLGWGLIIARDRHVCLVREMLHTVGAIEGAPTTEFLTHPRTDPNEPTTCDN